MPLSAQLIGMIFGIGELFLGLLVFGVFRRKFDTGNAPKRFTIKPLRKSSYGLSKG